MDASTLLAKEGYKLVNLKGGIIAWTKEEKPVVADLPNSRLDGASQ